MYAPLIGATATSTNEAFFRSGRDCHPTRIVHKKTADFLSPTMFFRVVAESYDPVSLKPHARCPQTEGARHQAVVSACEGYKVRILSPCVSSWIGTGGRLFLLYGWATYFFSSGLSHRRCVTTAVILDTWRAGPAASSHTPVPACMHWSSQHPSEQQAHHSGLDVLLSFLSHSITQESFDLGPLCRFGMRRVTVVVMTSRQHRTYVGTRQVYKGVLSGPRQWKLFH